MLWFCLGCPILQAPKYGSISAVLNNPKSGDVVAFTCNDGYNLLGSDVRTCLETAEWTGKAVSCQGIIISYGNVVCLIYKLFSQKFEICKCVAKKLRQILICCIILCLHQIL